MHIARSGPTMMATRMPVLRVTAPFLGWSPTSTIGLSVAVLVDAADVAVPVTTAFPIALVKVLSNVVVSVVDCAFAVIIVVYVLVITEYTDVSTDGGGVYRPAEEVVRVVRTEAVFVAAPSAQVALSCALSDIVPQTVVSFPPASHFATHIQVVSKPERQ